MDTAETRDQPTSVAVSEPVLSLRDVSVLFSGKAAVRNATFDVQANKVTSLIGPSGSGKTTLLRAMNRLHELTPGATVTGQILLEGEDLYKSTVPITVLRSRIGMVFQRPNPFPTMSILDNAVAGLRFIGVRDKAFLAESAEKALSEAALWDSVKDRLKAPAATLSGGEQQRLCIARAMAVEPEVLLMDEPTASLDPVATQQIEELVMSLKQFVTIVIVTHNMQQAARISDETAFFYIGELIEAGPTGKLFTNPSRQQTEDYVTGRFG